MELMGDDDDGLAVGPHGPQHVKEPVRLLGGEDGGGFVQDENLRPTVEDFDDLHRLLLRHGHVVDLLGGVDVEAVLAANGADLLFRGPDIQLAALLQAQDDVLRGGEHVHQLVVLVDHANAVCKGVSGGADGDGPAVYVDLPLVWKIDAGEHIHQCGFAAAVFPQQGQDFSPVQLQVDTVVGHHLAEALGDAFEFNGANSFFQ